MSVRDTSRRRRIALYSHDTVGLGHLRRNLALATALGAGSVPTDILLISGSREAVSFPVPHGIDYLTLPALAKRDGAYGPRTLGMSLGDLVDVRSAAIAAALASFDPDVLIVDKVARGACGELDLALGQLRQSGRTHCVLGLRDILDDAATTYTEWRSSGTVATIASMYDAVWVYGDQTVFDLPYEYALPAAVAKRLTFTGYLGHGRPRIPVPLDPALTTEPYVLCLVGGGQDGVALAETFTAEPLPHRLRGVVVTGPYMDPVDRRHLIERTAPRADLTILEFVPDCHQLIDRSQAVISMGGYNTVCELLAADKRPLIVPRVSPRIEQLIRAQRLADRGVADVLHPAALTPGALATWLEAELTSTAPQRQVRPIDLDGLRRVPGLVEQLLHDRTPHRELSHDAA